MRLPKILIRDLLTVWIMMIAASLIGLGANLFRDRPLPLVYSPKAERIQKATAKVAEQSPAVFNDADSPLPSTVGYLDLPAFREIVEHKTKGIVIDARPEIFHRVSHVPGAISLSREEFEADYVKKRQLLEADKSQLIAIYCSGSNCEDSGMVAEALVKLAYTHVFVFKGGWSEWTKAGLPKEKGQ